MASEEGIDIGTKEVRYEWTYVQSVFFSSTIITTVGKIWKKNIKQFKLNMHDLAVFKYTDIEARQNLH